MGKVNADKYGKSRPKVTIEDLEGGDFMVLKIAGFGEETFSDENVGDKVTPYLTFEETGEKVHWLNKTQVGYLIARLGDEADRWTGKAVPLEKVQPTYAGKKQPEKLWVAAPESWDQMLRDTGHGRSLPRTAVAKKSPAELKRKK